MLLTLSMSANSLCFTECKCPCTQTDAVCFFAQLVKLYFVYAGKVVHSLMFWRVGADPALFDAGAECLQLYLSNAAWTDVMHVGDEVLRLKKPVLNLASGLRLLSDPLPLLVSPASVVVVVLLIVMHIHGGCLAFHQHVMSNICIADVSVCSCNEHPCISTCKVEDIKCVQAMLCLASV